MCFRLEIKSFQRFIYNIKHTNSTYRDTDTIILNTITIEKTCRNIYNMDLETT